MAKKPTPVRTAVAVPTVQISGAPDDVATLLAHFNATHLHIGKDGVMLAMPAAIPIPENMAKAAFFLHPSVTRPNAGEPV